VLRISDFISLMFDKVKKILVKRFGRNERLIKTYSVIAQQAGEFEERINKLDDETLRGANKQTRRRDSKGKDR